jgi:predicted RNA-binding protein with PIN domain
VRWLIDGNNVFGSRPDGWWNDRSGAARRFAQRVAEWCRTHDDDVTIVFDAPVADATFEVAGGNLGIVEAPRRGRDAADDHIVDLVDDLLADGVDEQVRVITSDHGLRARLPAEAQVIGSGGFRELIGY